MATLKYSWYAAGADTTISNYERLVTKEFRHTNAFYTNKFMTDVAPMLISFGTNIAKPGIAKNGDKLYASNKELINIIYEDFHQKGDPFLVDSGGFLCSIGKVPRQYIPKMIEYYVKYIKENCEDPLYDDMLYFYLDIVPIAGLKKEEALEHMIHFHNHLKKSISHISGALDKMILVLQCSNNNTYEVFNKFIHETALVDLHSHKYSQGSLVPLNFNNYFISPWIIGLMDVIDIERDNLTNGTVIQFHLLGTSSPTEMILISWLNILFESRGINIIITFDSTAAINNASRSGILHYYDPNNKEHPITEFFTKYNTLKDKVLNRIDKNGRNYTNEDYINMCLADMSKEIVFNTRCNGMLYDSNGRWTPLANTFLQVYENYSYSKIFDYILSVNKQYKDWIINEDLNSRLRELTYKILVEFNGGYNLTNKKGSKLNSTTARLLNSLMLIRMHLDNKLPEKYSSKQIVDSYFKNNGLTTNERDAGNIMQNISQTKFSAPKEVINNA